MAKSIRISDDLYELALREAESMQRSLAQQIEHWVKLGVGLEHQPGSTLDDVRAAALQYRHVKDEADVRSGRRVASSLHAIPAAWARNAKVEYPKGAFATRRKSW